MKTKLVCSCTNLCEVSTGTKLQNRFSKGVAQLLHFLSIFYRQEKVLKAEATREEKLQQQKEKARQAEMKAYDVKRRKMALEAQAEALKKQG